MTRRGLLCVALVVPCFVLGPALAPVQAAGWADSLFGERAFDFGPVPRGAIVKHDFVMTNRLAEPVTILNLRPSCGCTSGKASTSVLAPGGSAVIQAQMDTRNFLGIKATVLFVTLVTAGGREAEVRLGVTSNILADIVLNPGSVDFGTVARGQTPSQVLSIDRIGAPGWRFERMVSASRALSAQLVESRRDPKGNVSYALTVGIKPDAPAGPLRDEIRLLSNDREAPSIPILVTAYVRGELSAAPSILAMGEVTSAAGKQGRFLIRGAHPFTIRAVEGSGDGFAVQPADPAKKTTHILTVVYKPEEGSTRGDLRHLFRVHTDLAGEPPLDLTATLHVAP